MAKSKKDISKEIKRISRQNQLDREKLVGKPRAKSFGGKPTAQEDRRRGKRKLKGLDSEENFG